MSPAFIALIFGGFAAIAVWSIQHDFATGIAGDPTHHFAIDDDPLGFAAIILAKAVTVAMGVAEILYATGVIADPFAALKTTLAFLA